MSRRRTIALRVLAVMLVSGLVGALSALVVADRIMRETLAAQLAPILAGRFTAADAVACAADPTRWHLAVAPSLGLRGYAYDEQGRAANPEAPPLRRSLRSRLGPDPGQTSIELRGRGRGGGVVVRTGAPGPCALVQIAWAGSAAAGRLATVVAVSAALASVFACGLGLVAIAIPLVRRIRALRQAAAHVGDAAGYPPHHATAGDELDAVGAALDRAHARIRSDAAALEARRDALERHLAQVAHDLRTPLTSLQVALEHVVDAVDEPLHEVAAGALRDTVYLGGLVHNLALASRLGAGWSPLDAGADRSVDLRSLVESVAGRARLLARRRDVELAVSCPDDAVLVAGNPVAVERALANLVDNAVAHGDRGGHVAIVLIADGEQFDLAIRDDGPGLPPAEVPRLGAEPRGRGLGLAITGEIAARLGWTLRFARLDPRGLEVRIRGARLHAS
jgi:signal transduction histidine kinase